MNIQVCWALSVLLLLICIAVFFRSRPFKLIVKPGRVILWHDDVKNLRIDVSVGFYNTGSFAGSVEDATIKFRHGDKWILCLPDMTYRFNDEGKLAPSGFWDSFILNGKHHREQIIGFKTDIPVSDLPDGSYDVILNVRYHKNLRQKKISGDLPSFSGRIPAAGCSERHAARPEEETAVFPLRSRHPPGSVYSKIR